eukprot:XP_002528206.2 uncharacterized protein LOC8277240 isoform X1 [Ricinus communis]
MKMEKRAALGVKKRKKPIKTNRKTLLKKVVDYLKSDSYLFAPLISSSPRTDHFLASKIVSSTSSSTTTSAVEMKENMKGKKKRFAEKVGDYLKSDGYLYAPVFAPKLVIFPKGVGKYSTRVNAGSMRKLINGENRSTVKTSNVTVEEDRFTLGDLPESSIPGQQKLVHRETVKHMVYQSCRSSSVSGKGMLDSQLRKILSLSR